MWDFVIDDRKEEFIDELFKTEKIKYRYKHMIYNEQYISDVYNFSKNNINYFKNFYKNEKLNGVPISISSYNLYVVYDGDDEYVKKHVFCLQVDKNGDTIKKEKFFVEEDFKIPDAFEIYILIELYTLPLSFPQKQIQDVLKPVFELCDEERRDIYEPIPNKIIRYKSKTIETGNNTTHEIFTQTLSHLINFQCLYKNDRIDDIPATTTTYTLEVVGDDLHRVLYHVEIDKDGVTTRESKPYEIISESINAPYKVYIKIGIYCHPGEQEENLEEMVNRLVEERINQIAQNAVNERTRWLEEQAQEAARRPRAEDLRVNIRSTREDMCCVCLAKPPNVMFSNCGHLCLCEECNDRLNGNHNFEVGNLKCPMCRTEVTQKRIIT